MRATASPSTTAEEFFLRPMRSKNISNGRARPKKRMILTIRKTMTGAVKAARPRWLPGSSAVSRIARYSDADAEFRLRCLLLGCREAADARPMRGVLAGWGDVYVQTRSPGLSQGRPVYTFSRRPSAHRRACMHRRCTINLTDRGGPPTCGRLSTYASSSAAMHTPSGGQVLL